MTAREEAWKRAVDEPAFSNGTEGYGWMANWCDRCLRDAPFRNGMSKQGCELILIAMCGDKRPAEWLDGPRDEQGRYSIEDQYHCIEFKAPGSGGAEPRPKPPPRGMEGLFERPEVQTRMYVQPQHAEVAP